MLALFHVSATMAINWRCELLLDEYAPIPDPRSDDISTPLSRRRDLAALLGRLILDMLHSDTRRAGTHRRVCRLRAQDRELAERRSRPVPATLAVLRDRARSLGQSLSGYLRDLMDADAAAETNAEVIARVARDREPVNLTMDDILAARDEGRR